MKFGAKYFLCIIIILGISIGTFLKWSSNNLRPRYREAAEEPLVDFGLVFAGILETAAPNEPLSVEAVAKVMESVKGANFQAKIYQLKKTGSDIRVYVTDKSGIVLYDSYRPENIGADYSRWRDVYLALRGQYGARTTRDNEQDTTSSVLYVAAPVHRNGETVGIVSVGKPTKQINLFVQMARAQLFQWAALTLGILGFVGLLLMAIMTRPIRQLIKYANDVRDGKPAQLPKLPRDEIGELGNAFEEMRVALEGKKYIEHYIQTLTHELKSPISGIKGAVELLLEKPPPEVQAKFLDNIKTEGDRMTQIVERLLSLSALEVKDELSERNTLNVSEILSDLIYTSAVQANLCKIKINFSEKDVPLIYGDEFLLRQAFSNLIDNALAFAKSEINISVEAPTGQIIVEIVDDGPGIPDYALSRVFERFFSLPRPDSGKKSSGLGLTFVAEVIRLHDGKIDLRNSDSKGVQATVILPASLTDRYYSRTTPNPVRP